MEFFHTHRGIEGDLREKLSSFSHHFFDCSQYISPSWSDYERKDPEKANGKPPEGVIFLWRHLIFGIFDVNKKH